MNEEDNIVRNPLTGAPLSRPVMPLSFILLIILILLVVRYRQQKDTTDNPYVRTHEWKATEGYTIGDWISFGKESPYELRNDTLFRDHSAVAVVVVLKKAFLFGDNKLHIRSIPADTTGIYTEK